MASKTGIISSFIEAAPPGEVAVECGSGEDIKTLVGDDLQSYEPAFKKYHEEQYTAVDVPGGSGKVLLSQYNSLGSNRYFDPTSSKSFAVSFPSLKTSDAESHSPETSTPELIQSLQSAFSKSTAEHFPSSTIGVFPTGSDIAILIVANKYSPQNFWNGRWRSTYILSDSGKLSGTIRVDVHYYEDGNVRMQTEKEVSGVGGSGGAESVVREIAKAENKFQEELNRGFVTMAEGSFKGLRRQLPVTRQRVEWEKIGGYRLGQDIGGGRSK
ncbi:hypothetical protein B0A48_10634 [Cryoendolithus antarcticus]|uniref:F-actin-capping protein subunit alpha n=1 Tax=Cryoendolithus antarcticus TaxID=1507870 RepID=A0A1V8SY91_9PEZI|nr:hypothetical protein B0A48_10634 [Cryoendolithus antarcticus]